MKVERNKLPAIKDRTQPVDWFLLSEPGLNNMFFDYLIEEIDLTETIMLFPSGAGQFASLLIQSGFNVIGVEDNDRYRFYSQLINARNFEAKAFEESTILMTENDLIIHPLCLFFDSAKSLEEFLVNYFSDKCINRSRVYTVLFVSDVDIDLRQKKGSLRDALVINNSELSGIVKLLKSINIDMNVVKRDMFSDEEKKVEYVVISFSPTP